jgi:HSP20 family molecular chaperone IbpA
MTLVLNAQRPREKAEDQVCFVCIERSHGNFHHAVHIPVNIDPGTITAEYRRGVLRVTCKKNGDHQVPIKEILD